MSSKDLSFGGSGGKGWLNSLSTYRSVNESGRTSSLLLNLAYKLRKTSVSGSMVLNLPTISQLPERERLRRLGGKFTMESIVLLVVASVRNVKVEGKFWTTVRWRTSDVTLMLRCCTLEGMKSNKEQFAKPSIVRFERLAGSDVISCV